MEMHQFIGDLITSGSTSKDHADVLTAAWGGAGETLGFKGVSPEPLQRPRPAQDKLEPGRQTQSGQSQRRGEPRNRREDFHYTCTCPGRPFSTSPPTFEVLRPRQYLSSPQRSDGVCNHLPDTEPSSSTRTPELETRMSSQPQREETERQTQSTDQNSDTPHCSATTSSLSHLSMFPCLCCHRSLQTCTQILSHQEGTNPLFSHTHAHHHFHHHHCPLTSCLPCPQFVRSRAPQLAGPFSCLTCQHSFPGCTQECQLQNTQTHSQQQEERGMAAMNTLTLHPCMHCSASFSRPSQLLQHQRSEHAHKPTGFLCTECGRTFNSHSNLRIHQNVHTGARPYSCSDCGKSFSQSGALKIHRRLHTGERPYSCGFCGRGFPHLAGVRAHQRTHTGEKPYSCIQCGKCFTQSGALKIHIRIHTGERPFICSFCGKGFSNRSGIRFHYRTVHGLSTDPVGEAGAGGASVGPVGRGFPPGRPRTFRLAEVGLNTSDSQGNNSSPALHPMDSPVSTAAHQGSAVLRGAEKKSQSEGPNQGNNREVLLYTCEDCGLRFKDAPSRNSHQTLMHYSSEREEGQNKESSTSQWVRDNSGE